MPSTSPWHPKSKPTVVDLPRPLPSHTLHVPDGMVTLYSDTTDEITFERALFLLEMAKQQLLENRDDQ